ncbi:MAG: hypothetical protein ACFFD1_04890 [Candidatus Thorarchaeota archaeon]
MNYSDNSVFSEEKDLPQRINLVDQKFSAPEKQWETCYCGNREIFWYDSHCGSLTCQKRAYNVLIDKLTTYNLDYSNLEFFVNKIPKKVLDSLYNENYIFKIGLIIPDDVINLTIENSFVPLELLFYIFYYKPDSSKLKIINHPQLKNNLLDHILKKKIDTKEIRFLQSFPTILGEILWTLKDKQKWKQALNKIFDLPYTSEKTLAYLLNCSLNSIEENKIRAKILTNPRIMRISEETRSLDSYAKIDVKAHHWCWEIRNIVAQYEKTQKRILELLSRSFGYYSKEIKISVIQNPSTPPKIIQNILIGCDEEEIILVALKRPDLSTSTYESYLDNINEKIRESALLSLALLSE